MADQHAFRTASAAAELTRFDWLFLADRAAAAARAKMLLRGTSGKMRQTFGGRPSRGPFPGLRRRPWRRRPPSAFGGQPPAPPRLDLAPASQAPSAHAAMRSAGTVVAGATVEYLLRGAALQWLRRRRAGLGYRPDVNLPRWPARGGWMAPPMWMRQRNACKSGVL